MSKHHSSLLRYLSNNYSYAHEKCFNMALLLLCKTLNLLLGTDGAALVALQHRKDLPVQSVHCVTHEEFIPEPDFRYLTAAGSVLHENSSFCWKSPAVFQAFCKWGNCARAQCPPGNVLVLAIFYHLALKLGFNFYVEKLICPLQKNIHSLEHCWCRLLMQKIGWIRARESYICTEVFKKQYPHYWLVHSYLIPLLGKCVNSLWREKFNRAPDVVC